MSGNDEEEVFNSVKYPFVLQLFIPPNTVLSSPISELVSNAEIHCFTANLFAQTKNSIVWLGERWNFRIPVIDGLRGEKLASFASFDSSFKYVMKLSGFRG